MSKKTSETSESNNVGEWSNSMKKSLEVMRLQLMQVAICSHSSNFKNHEIELSFEDDYALLETDKYIYKIKIDTLYQHIDAFEFEGVNLRGMLLGFLGYISDDVIDKNSNDKKIKILELWSIDGIKLLFNGIYAFMEIGDLIYKLKIEILYDLTCCTTPDKIIRHKYHEYQLTLRSDDIINKSGEFVKSRKYNTKEINKYLLAKEEFYNA